MATICKKCGGIIPDVFVPNAYDRSLCKNHTKPNVNIPPNYSSNSEEVKDD